MAQMTKELSTKIILVIVVGAVGLETILTEANDAYGQWMLPADVNELHQSVHHRNPGSTAEGNNETTITRIFTNKP
jgi:hypothetical protein